MSTTNLHFDRVRNTIAYLRRCQKARAAGYPVSLKTDPAWLVDVAIDRRAGWAEDPHYFGIAQPVNGRLPRRATGDHQRHLLQLAGRINTPRQRIYWTELGEWSRYLVAHLPDRFATHDHDDY